MFPSSSDEHEARTSTRVSNDNNVFFMLSEFFLSVDDEYSAAGVEGFDVAVLDAGEVVDALGTGLGEVDDVR